ncbi:Hypothetical_protein [Hexamita inflata]|uniref:Hypothetical_protein n=1 Tax=Hexamita inflata TaxID=28002 RepID=A0AA86U9R7_9EUKA|nr:Hypothetical protein HINF_LOCUS22128 [Hexamita inflata]CAI9937926.1 Hypothetical protein HINF_LOCUS25571 [Hexamita inflata]
MFVFKPIYNSEYYISLSCGKLQLMDKNGHVCGQKQINYYFEPGQTEIFCESSYFTSLFKIYLSSISYQLLPAHLNSVCQFDSKIYFILFDLVFVVTFDLNIEFVCQLKQFAVNVKGQNDFRSKSGQLFHLDGKLLVHDCSSNLYQILNNKLKLVSKKQVNIRYYQFCDKVIAFDGGRIYKVNNNLKLETICDVESSDVIFAQGATLVLRLKYLDYYNKTQYSVFNMLDNRYTYSNQFNFDEFNQYLELGPTGLQLKNEVLCKIFYDDKISEHMTNYYNEYQNSHQLQNKQQYGELIFQSQISSITQSLFKLTEIINLKRNAITDNIRKYEYADFQNLITLFSTFSRLDSTQ